MTKKEMVNREKCLRMFDLEYSVCSNVLAEGSGSSDFFIGTLRGMAEAFFKLSLIDYDTFEELLRLAMNIGSDS